MARSTRAKRTRSTFRKSTGTTLRRGTAIRPDGFGKEREVSRQVGGHGHFLNNCRCVSCRESSPRFI